MMRPSHGLMLAVIGLLVLATVMVNSASLSLGGNGQTTLEGMLMGKHAAYALLAVAALAVGAFVPVDRLLTLHTWRSPLLWVAVVMVAALLLVHAPGIGREANGARRWIALGPVGLQPSEIAKWVMPMLVACYAVRYRVHMGEFRRGFLYPLLAVSAVCGLIAVEDLGTAVLIELVAIAMLVAAGARWQFAAALAPLGLAAVAVLIVVSPYRVNRIMAYLNPYADSRGIGYHIIQSMEAIQGGGLAGRGLGNSVQKFGYLPEGTTDFIYAIIAEELGLPGAALVVALYVLLVLCGVAIVTRNRGEGHEGRLGAPLLSNGAQLLGMGIVFTVGLQALINVAVVTGLVPTKGIALPLMSRGGTGWILTGFSLGLLVAMERMADRAARSAATTAVGSTGDGPASGLQVAPGAAASDPVPA